MPEDLRRPPAPAPTASGAVGRAIPTADRGGEPAPGPAPSLRQRIDADRLARLGSLTAAAVHGLRNPLVSVKSFLQLLSERYEDVEFRERFSRLAVRELARVEELLDDLAGLARDRGAASAELAPALAAAGRLLGHCARACASELRLEGPRPGVRVPLGPTDLQHLLVALGMHALSWGGRGSRLHLEVSEVGHGEPGAPTPPAMAEIRLRCMAGEEAGAGERFPPEARSLPPVIELLAARAGGSVRSAHAAGGELELRIRLPATG